VPAVVANLQIGNMIDLAAYAASLQGLGLPCDPAISRMAFWLSAKASPQFAY
jgi:hypothetical protein